MEIAKCCSCGKIIRAEDTVYTVYRGELYGEPAIAPACCEACSKRGD